MSYFEWYVGMPVVNTRPVEFQAGPGIAPEVEIGSIYVISEMMQCSAGQNVNGVILGRDYLFIKLVDRYGWYDVKLFRPVQVRKTSIEVFERLLNPTPHDKHLIEVFDFVSMQGDLQ